MEVWREGARVRACGAVLWVGLQVFNHTMQPHLQA
jgi:hypothetical protein